jgi:hypothetical protein
MNDLMPYRILPPVQQCGGTLYNVQRIGTRTP